MKHIEIDIAKLVKTLLAPCVCALGMYFCASGSKIYLDDYISNDIAMLVTLVAVGGISYPILAFSLFYKNTLVMLKELNEMFFKKRIKH